MKEVKTKSSDRTPRILSEAARAPKELARRRFISTKEQAEHTAAQTDDSESPTEYAENRLEQSADEMTRETLNRGKQIAQKANDTRKKIKEIRNQADEVKSRTNTARQQGSSKNNSYRAGKERVTRSYRQTRKAQATARKSVQQTARATKGTVKTAQNTAKAAKGTVKTAQKTVKTARHTVKAAEKGVKTAAKATQKAAQAAVKAAQMAAKAAQAAAKAAVAAAKAAVKVITAIIKAIIAAVKALIAAIAAGGWVAVVIIIVVVLIVALLSVFGVFSANEAADGSKPMTEAIQTINSEFKTSIDEKIAELSSSGADAVEIIYEGDMESVDSPVPNWADVIAVYSAKTSFDPDNPAYVTVVNEENIERLRTVFNDMNSVSYRTETETETVTVTDEYGAVELDENGDPVTKTTTTLYIYVNVVSTDYLAAGERYVFNDDQLQMLDELMLPDYYPLFAELVGDSVGDGGEYGSGLNINPDLPPNELGAQLVEAAKKYIGRSYSSMDCSGLVRAAYRDCGLSSLNGLTSTGMAEKCRDMGVLFTDASQLQAGDLIFFARKDASRGEGYCTDRRRCGSGKCKRWMQIHHVAIYINDEFLIDSTGGNNSVQIRKHWGKNGSEWQWVCFGRPTS